VQAHTLGEVGNLGIVLLRVSSGTILPIFVEIGSYLTDKEQKISWHSFFETRCIVGAASNIRAVTSKVSRSRRNTIFVLIHIIIIDLKRQNRLTFGTDKPIA